LYVATAFKPSKTDEMGSTLYIQLSHPRSYPFQAPQRTRYSKPKPDHLQTAQPSQALEGGGSAGMRAKLQCLQLLQRAQGLQAAEAEEV
jgi:hypothetical protein